MALVQRVPHNPDAIDIAAIQRREHLKVWHRSREADAPKRHSFWRDLLRRW